MEKAKIIHIEDDPFFSNIVRMSLELDDSGHMVVERAFTMEEATKSLYSKARNESVFNVVLLDGNLSHDSHNGSDAMKIINIIKELKLDVITIGCSGIILWDNFIEVDYEINKTDFTVDKLVKLIDEI
jgi:hypothetical protein